MTELPRVSVIMTTYNSAPYLGAAIQSVIDQTINDWELLIGDDASTDHTKEVLAGFTDPRIRVFTNEVNLHYLRTRNKLLPWVHGKYVALLDADDWYSPEKLARQLKAFEADSDLGLCGTLVTYADKTGVPIPTRDVKPLSYTEIKKQLQIESAMTGSSIMVKTEILREFGGYRDFFNGRGFEDYDLTSRIAEKYKTINLPEPLYGYRQYEESTSRKDLLKDPFKLHGHLLIRHFIQQRAAGQKDSLERNDLQEIEVFMDACHEPYRNDPSLVHREVMWSYLHRKLNRRAYCHAFTALRLRPFARANWKGLVLLLLISSGLRRF